MKIKELMCRKMRADQISQIEGQVSKHNASLKLKIQVSIRKNILLQVNFSNTVLLETKRYYMLIAEYKTIFNVETIKGICSLQKKRKIRIT